MENEQKNEMTLEEGFEKLDRLMEKMEDSSLPLEERFELYKKGMELIRACTEIIDMVEKKLTLIQNESSKSGAFNEYK